MLALLVFGMVSVAIASPAPSVPAYIYGDLQYQTDNDLGPQVQSTIEGMIKESCERNGDASSFINFIEARNQFQRNLTANVIVEAMILVERRVHPDKTKLICGLKSTIKTGLVNMATAFRPCVQDEDRQTLDRVLETADSLLNYVCFNDGENVASFINEGGVQCVQDHKPKISECASKVFGDRIEPVDSQELSDDIDDYEPFTKDGKEQKKRHECQALVDLKTCVMNELDQCPNPSSSTFVTGLLDSVITPFCQ